MAQPHPDYRPTDYRPIIDERSDLERSPEQVAHEAAMTEVAETLANIEAAIRRAERGRKTVATLGRDRNTELALRAAAEALQAAHHRLFQEGYFGGDQQRLI